MLDRLFAAPALAQLLMFKGGTSLSKAYGLIERFSEDIDLILDWRVLGGADPLAERTRTQQNRLNGEIDEQAMAYIAGSLLEQVAAVLGDVGQCNIGADDPHVIDVRYPAAFADTYLRPELRLEIGPLAAWLPHETRTIGCYAAHAFPQVFARRHFPVRVVRAERTFWEKATILHHEAHRPAGNPQPSRYSRHYYDLARMAASPIKDTALADTALLAEVVAFKQRFYPRNWARYDLAVPGSLRLMPQGAVLAAVEADYRAMSGMIFGQTPNFADIQAQLNALEDDINGMCSPRIKEHCYQDEVHGGLLSQVNRVIETLQAHPGQLPPEWTVARLLDKHSSLSFNPDVANAFFRVGMIESWGRGIERMLETCRQAGVAEPALRYEHSGLWVNFAYAASPTTGSVTGSVTGSATGSATGSVTDPLHRLVLILAEATLAPSELRQRLGLRHRPTFRENYLRPALRQGLIEMTLPDRPGSRLQQYRLTDAGQAMWASLKRKDSP